MSWSERVQSIVLPLKTLQVFKDQIRNAFKKRRKTFLKRVIQNTNILIVTEDLSTICIKDGGGKYSSGFNAKLKKKTTLLQHNTKSSIRLTHLHFNRFERAVYMQNRKLISKGFSNSKELLLYNFWLNKAGNTSLPDYSWITARKRDYLIN